MTLVILVHLVFLSAAHWALDVADWHYGVAAPDPGTALVGGVASEGSYWRRTTLLCLARGNNK